MREAANQGGKTDEVGGGGARHHNNKPNNSERWDFVFLFTCHSSQYCHSLPSLLEEDML